MVDRIENSTQSSSIKWVVEIYPFNSDVPGSSDFAASLTPPITLISSPATESSSEDALHKIAFGNQSPDFIGPVGAVVTKSFGLQSISLARDKSKPDATCLFTMIGPLSASFVSGNWVVISSGQDDQSSPGLRTVVKFIGQIETISVSYTSTQDGNILVVSQIELREWSTILTSKLLYDFRSVNRLILDNAAGGTGSALGAVASEFEKIKNNAGGSSIAEEIESFSEVLKKSFDPFECAHVILRLMGAISENDTLSKATKASAFFHKTALSPPKIPPDLIARLGITAPESGGTVFATPGSALVLDGTLQAGYNTVKNNVQSQWTNGFVRVITGVKPPKKFAYGDWNGVFGAQPDQTIEAYSTEVKNNYEKSQYKIRAQSVLMNLPSQFTAWRLMNEFCEPVMNEIYTDVWHEYKGNASGPVVARPVVVIRDKPFSMIEIVQNTNKMFKYKSEDAKDAILGNYTLYDDLPRIRINASSILKGDFNNTFLTSPNYILLNFASPIFDRNMGFAASAIGSGIRLEDEQNRFGGQEYFAEAQFLGPDLDNEVPKEGKSFNKPDSPFTKWFSLMTEMSRIWYSYLYRMGTGSLVIKDDNYAISVGFNIQFKFGYFELVGHVDGFQESFMIEEDGTEITTKQIKLSRIVYQPASNGIDNNTLRLLPPDAWGRMFDPDYAQIVNSVEPIERDGGSKSSFIGDVIDDFFPFS